MTEYNALKKTYDDAFLLERDRKNIEIKKTLQEAYQLPQRPCPPAQPPMYDFAKITWDPSTYSTLATYTSGRLATLADAATDVANWASGTLNKKAWSRRTGFLQANVAETTAVLPQNVGHIFGRMGQGERTSWMNGEGLRMLPFAWDDMSASTSRKSMMVSLLPIRVTDDGLTSAKNITMQVTVLKFWDKTTFVEPVQPTAATPPVSQAFKTLTSMASIGVTLALFSSA